MQVFILVLVVSILKTVSNGAEFELPPGFLYFPNLEVIKSYFRNDTFRLSKTILETFEKDCLYTEDPGVPTGRRKPFIVIEGNHRAARNVMGLKLARRLNGRYLNNLAPCLHYYFKQLPQGSITRRVFYLLSVYASVFNAKVHLNLNRAVILNGYWWEQVTFSLLHALGDNPLPPVSADIFQYPPDLLQPDLIVYAYQPILPGMGNRSVNKRSVEMYQKLSNRHPIMIQSLKIGFKDAIDNVYGEIRGNLSKHRDFRYKADPYYE